MIRAYSKLPNSPDSINLFRRMITLSDAMRLFFPDKYTFTFVISSCTHQMLVVHGQIVHSMVVKNGYESNLYVGNSLINMYSLFNQMKDAHNVFDEMLVRDVFSWTSLVCGYAKQGEMDSACEIFGVMSARNEVSWAVMISGFVGGGR